MKRETLDQETAENAAERSGVGPQRRRYHQSTGRGIREKTRTQRSGAKGKLKKLGEERRKHLEKL